MPNHFAHDLLVTVRFIGRCSLGYLAKRHLIQGCDHFHLGHRAQHPIHAIANFSPPHDDLLDLDFGWLAHRYSARRFVDRYLLTEHYFRPRAHFLANPNIRSLRAPKLFFSLLPQ